MNFIVVYKSILQIGGAEKFFFEFIKALSNKHNVKVICKEYDTKVLEHFNFSSKNLISPNRVNYYSWFRFLNKNISKTDLVLIHSGMKDIFLLSLIRRFKFYVFLHHPYFHTFFHADILSYIHKTNKEYFLKDPTNQTYYKQIKKLFKKKSIINIELNAVINYLAIRKAKNIYVLSNYGKNEKKKYFNVNSKYIVPGISNDFLKHIGEKIKKEKRLIYFGRLVKEKRINILVEAFKNIKSDFELLIVGEGEEKENLIKIAKNDNRIKFLGFVSDIELIKLIQTSKLLVTLEWADFNLTVYESISLGTRVLFGKTTGIENFDLQFIDNEMLFFTEVNINDVMNNINKIIRLGDPTSQNYTFIKNYNWDNYIKIFLKSI